MEESSLDVIKEKLEIGKTQSFQTFNSEMDCEDHPPGIVEEVRNEMKNKFNKTSVPRVENKEINIQDEKVLQDFMPSISSSEAVSFPNLYSIYTVEPEMAHEDSFKEEEMQMVPFNSSTEIIKSSLKLPSFNGTKSSSGETENSSVYLGSNATSGSIPQFNCSLCIKTFANKYQLKRHEKIHSGEKPFKCPHCPKQFGYKDGLRIHIRIHIGGERFLCCVCEKSFLTQKSMILHMKEKDCQAEIDENFPCPTCNKVFPTKTILKNHEKSHQMSRPFKCSQCPMSYLAKTALRRHEMSHTGVKPFKCSECGKAFQTKGEVKNHHSMVHLRIRPFKCDLCGKEFLRKRKLQDHLKKYHSIQTLT